MKIGAHLVNHMAETRNLLLRGVDPYLSILVVCRKGLARAILRDGVERGVLLISIFHLLERRSGDDLVDLMIPISVVMVRQ